MNSINPHSFDKWAFEYLEGNLNHSEQIAFEKFLETHPEYNVEMQAWESSHMNAPEVVPFAISIPTKAWYSTSIAYKWFGSVALIGVLTFGYISWNKTTENTDSLANVIVQKSVVKENNSKLFTSNFEKDNLNEKLNSKIISSQTIENNDVLRKTGNDKSLQLKKNNSNSSAQRTSVPNPYLGVHNTIYLSRKSSSLSIEKLLENHRSNYVASTNEHISSEKYTVLLLPMYNAPLIRKSYVSIDPKVHVDPRPRELKVKKKLPFIPISDFGF